MTMYGLPVEDVLPRLHGKDLLIVVGAEKVPGEIFELADFNVAVTNQPHSEVGALAVMLDKLFYGSKLKKEHLNGKFKIIDRKSTRLNSSHAQLSRMPSSA